MIFHHFSNARLIIIIRVASRSEKCILLEPSQKTLGGRTGLVVRASDSGSGDPGSILGRVGVLFP